MSEKFLPLRPDHQLWPATVTQEGILYRCKLGTSQFRLKPV